MPVAASLLRGLLPYAQKLRWAAIAFIVVFCRPGQPSLMDPDEAHYAQITREMIRAGNWLVPLLDGKPYIDKPIFFHWLQGASMTLFGETEFAARLPSALAAIGLIWITRRLGRALFGESVGDWGAIMLATIPITFALSSIAIFDMIFTALLFGGIACLLIAGREGRWQVEAWGYALLAFAGMTKGPVALLLVAVFCSAAWVAGGELRAWACALHWKLGLTVATFIAAPWFIWMHGRFDAAFVEGYILAGNLHYFTQPESFSQRAISHTFYARAFAGGFFPWSAIAVARAIDLFVTRRRRPDAAEKLLWLWAVLIVVFFSAARFKLDHYIFPAAPAICLIAAKAWRDAAEDVRASAVRPILLGLGALLVVGGTFLSVYLFELDLELPASAIVLPMVLAVGGMATLAASAHVNWRVPAAPLAPVVTLLSVYAIVVTIGFPTLERTHPTGPIARTFKQRTRPDAPSGIYRLEQWRASLRYYADRPLASLSTPADVAAFMAQHDRPVYILMRRREFRALRADYPFLYEVFRCRAVVGTTKTRSGLRRQQWGDLVFVTNSRRPVRWWLP